MQNLWPAPGLAQSPAATCYRRFPADESPEFGERASPPALRLAAVSSVLRWRRGGCTQIPGSGLAE